MVQTFVRAAVLVAALVAPSRAAQSAARAPQPTCIRGVTIGRSAETGSAATLLLREGRIEAVLDAAAPVPPGYRIVEGAGLFCLPAFLDAYTRTGCATPEPAKDQDLPVDTSADVGIDMRQANRKGIEPAFRAALALAFDPKDSKSWREAGFGVALVAPTGQILAGTSCLAVTREAAARDAVFVSDAFAHAAFAASGEGYPSTMMGYVAQLRQFLLDARRHVELVRRAEENRPGARPPFDRELEAGAELLAGERRLLCEADRAVDIERWIALADEFGLTIGIVGGREAWRVAGELARRDIPVVLTLDFGPEPKDPARPAKQSDAPEEKALETAAEEPAAEAEAETETEAEAAPTKEPEVVWEYEEPLVVRRERRRLWEEGRDCARVLREAGVRFAFGTAGEKPAKLLEKVRSLVEAGLPADAAFSALGDGAAEILGVSEHLGKVVVGSDATLALWTADPLVDAKAKTRWIFVDGYPTEFREEKEKAGKPAEGVDPSGRWTLEIQGDEGPISGDLTLEMEEDGSTEGKLETENPVDQSDLTVELTGKLAGTTLELRGTLDLGGFQVELTLTLEVEKESLTGQAAVLPPGQATPEIQRVTGTRVPEGAGRSVR
jgi:imidazolonepropionase-like amidohydrolase